MVSRQTVTLANSIVGVSVLAMPFCFKQCGIILATLMLMIGAVLTRTVCYFLLKSGTITRRRNYEMLAWHTFGQGGKFIVEISIIGFLIGTLIAFFVVMGDLGPEIVSEIFDIENNFSLRNIIMTGLCLFVALPLGLLRNIDSLSSVSTASVLFYVFLVFKILSEGMGPLFSGSYLDRVDYWRPAGVLQCIPIFSMALSCQTQIFGIYESLPEPSLQKMNDIVKQAVNICTIFYFCIGFFGYIAFSHQSFGGNILMTFSQSWTTQLIKTCFLMSIVFSVPLVVFPCRASLHSLIFRRVQMHHSLHDISTNYIPDGRLKFLTIIIISFTLIIGILIPNIELVLGLVGSTTGTVICIIFPSIMFIRVTSKQTTERLLAQVIFVTGVVMMVVSTYATLYAVEQAQLQVDEPLSDQIRVTEILRAIKAEDKKATVDTASVKISLDHVKFEKKQATVSSTKKSKPLSDKVNVIQVEDKEMIKMKDSENSVVKPVQTQNVKQPIDIVENPKQVPNSYVNNIPDLKTKQIALQQPENSKSKVEHDKQTAKEIIKNNFPSKKIDELKPIAKDPVETHPNIEIMVEEDPKASNNQGQQLSDNLNHPNDIQHEKEAEFKQEIKESEKKEELFEQKDYKESEKKEVAEKDVANLLKKLEEHEVNQKKFLEEQRQVLAELKEHHAQDVQRQKADEEKDPSLNEDPKNSPGNLEPRPNDKQTVDKIEVIQQEKLIKKFSENIEKEQQNSKLIEKIEEGLNKEIKNIESEPKFDKINIPDPIPPDTPLEPKKIIATAVEKLKKIPPQPQDPLIIPPAPPMIDSKNNNNKRVLKPIPVQVSEKKSSSNIPYSPSQSPPPAVGQQFEINNIPQILQPSPNSLVIELNVLDSNKIIKVVPSSKNNPSEKIVEPAKVDRDI